MNTLKKFKTTTLANEVASYLRRQFLLSDEYPRGRLSARTNLPVL
jgi:hypothetical protein